MQTLNALFGVAYVREHLKSRTSVGQPWATDTPSLGASLFKCPVTRLLGHLPQIVFPSYHPFVGERTWQRTLMNTKNRRDSWNRFRRPVQEKRKIRCPEASCM